MEVNINHTWKKLLEEDLKEEYFINLMAFLEKEHTLNTCYPEKNNIFAAFNYCSFNDTRVVILGQDPYHGKNQANGLCFSVNKNERIPPSLKNIFKELKVNLGNEIPLNGDLTNWAKQGVLLLNSVLTVVENKPGSHKNKGWEIFTNNVIKKISANKENIVFLLWGNYAISKEDLIDKNKHLILKAAHPSPFSVYKGFFGCNHFNKVNSYLKDLNKPAVLW